MNKEDYSYILEKSEYVIEALVDLQRYINRYDLLTDVHGTGETVRSIVSGDIHAAMYDLTKILVWVGQGTKWDAEDADLLLKDVKTGLRLLHVKYGIWQAPSEKSQDEGKLS